ncbi:hypothetical protein JN11_00386 [Mucilaginibacter frigoritolerans]|uniref:Uncharacterized protein n=1 Tax=Mucilaginibacter frigoritolerans TaxID=652788 RepID=A0A562UFQ9_9SPHI|nr:hypothetical protein [Mucilaginibacter frigoritolerans]TWJ04666.1 hypothetical protein JN11_00386 [Mucilaginibacter frigoritolerans]
MKKIITTGLSAMLLLTVFHKEAVSQQPQPHPKPKVSHHNYNGDFDGHLPGTWDAVVKDGEVNIQFFGEHWSDGRDFTTVELGTLPADKVGEFSLTRESGKLNFKGVFQDHWGHGTYQFNENPAFKSYLAQKGYKGLDNELMLNIFFTDISKGYFDYLKANGYPSISNGQLADLAQQNLTHKVLEDYFNLFKTEGYSHQSIDKIVELREHGVDARFVNSFHHAGYKNIPLDKALELRDHGVNVEFITSIQKMGYEKVSLDRAQELRDHGVNPEFIADMQNIGYKDISLEKAQELRDHGVNPEFIKSINELGFKDISLDQAQELRDHGVNASFIKKAQSKGMNLHTLDDYIKLRDTGFND